jgi:hypothetical protein
MIILKDVAVITLLFLMSTAVAEGRHAERVVDSCPRQLLTTARLFKRAVTRLFTVAEALTHSVRATTTSGRLESYDGQLLRCGGGSRMVLRPDGQPTGLGGPDAAAAGDRQLMVSLLLGRRVAGGGGAGAFLSAAHEDGEEDAEQEQEHDRHQHASYDTHLQRHF